MNDENSLGGSAEHILISKIELQMLYRKIREIEQQLQLIQQDNMNLQYLLYQSDVENSSIKL